MGDVSKGVCTCIYVQAKLHYLSADNNIQLVVVELL